MTTEKIEYILQVLDLNNPLTKVDQSSPEYEPLQTIPMRPNAIFSVGRPTRSNSPNIPLKAEDISRKQGLVYVLEETQEDERPIVVYQDTGRNKPVATLNGYHTDLRKTRLQEGKKIRIHLGESLTFGKGGSYALKFTEAKLSDNSGRSPFAANHNSLL